jgi:hypothetical protein
MLAHALAADEPASPDSFDISLASAQLSSTPACLSSEGVLVDENPLAPAPTPASATATALSRNPFFDLCAAELPAGPIAPGQSFSVASKAEGSKHRASHDGH